MGTLTIGRAGVDVLLSGPSNWNLSGDDVTFAGEIHAATLADAQAAREQLLGHANNPDEPVVPISWSDDSTVAGFYRISDVKVTTVRASFDTFWFPFTVAARRILSYRSPLFESTLTGALRTNSAGITASNARPWIGVLSADESSNALTAISPPGGTGFGTDAPLLMEDGSYSRLGHTGSVLTEMYDTRLLITGQPSRWYQGAATLKVGSPYRTVVGRQIEDSAYWQLSNGLIRVDSGVTPTSLAVWIEAWDGVGSAWVSRTAFIPTYDTTTAADFDFTNALTVLRNSPEEVIIRVRAQRNTVSGTFDIGLRRGARYVTCVYNAPELGEENYGMFRGAATLATSVTGGIHKTADDAAGNRWVLASSKAITKNLTNGGIYLTGAALTFDSMIGIEFGGTTATGLNAAQDMIYQYHGAVSERRLPVSG